MRLPSENFGHLARALLLRGAFFSLLFAAMGVTGAHAFDPAPAKLCEAAIDRVEAEMSLPAQILLAIGMVESGRWDAAAERTVPWPWTVYAEGKGRAFASKTKAIAAVQELRQRGVTNIDVGCMQINLYHHGDAFASIDQALDPASNVQYAGEFLTRLQDDLRSWNRALARYHSATPKFARVYGAKISKAWTKARRYAAAARRLARIEAYEARKAKRAQQRLARIKASQQGG